MLILLGSDLSLGLCSVQDFEGQKLVDNIVKIVLIAATVSHLLYVRACVL